MKPKKETVKNLEAIERKDLPSNLRMRGGYEKSDEEKEELNEIYPDSNDKLDFDSIGEEEQDEITEQEYNDVTEESEEIEEIKDEEDSSVEEVSKNNVLPTVISSSLSPKEDDKFINNLELTPPSEKKVEVSIQRNLSSEAVRKFTKEEVSEIHNYVETNAPFSLLNTMPTIVEKPYQKAQVFTVIYRILYTAMRSVASEETKVKLENLLKETEETYAEVYRYLVLYEGTEIHFSKHKMYNRIINVFANYNKNKKINELIDVFIVFSEKQMLMDLDKIVGFDLDEEAGSKALSDLMSGLDVRKE